MGDFFQSGKVDVIARTPEFYHHFGFDLIYRNYTSYYSPGGESSAEWKNEKGNTGGQNSVNYFLFPQEIFAVLNKNR